VQVHHLETVLYNTTPCDERLDTSRIISCIVLSRWVVRRVLTVFAKLSYLAQTKPTAGERGVEAQT